MDYNSFKPPSHLKVASLLISTFLIVYILYVGQDIIIPLVLAVFFASLLNPLVNFFQRKKIPRVLAISLAIMLAFCMIASVVYFIVSQASLFAESLPLFREKLNILLQRSVQWMAHTFNLQAGAVSKWLEDATTAFVNNSGAYIGSTLSTITGILVVVLLVPIYTLMMLYYQPLFLEFLKQAFPANNRSTVSEIILESQLITQSYLSGLLIEGVVVAALNTVGLMLIGIDYALLWGIVGALLNIIPYIGIVIALIFPVMTAIVTKDSVSSVLMVTVLYIVVQFVDNNIIVPKVVASRVKINALISIIVVLIGGSLWGITGMFLSIPITGVFKIIFDRIAPLRPYGYLLGDTMPDREIRLIQLLKFRRRKRFRDRGSKPESR